MAKEYEPGVHRGLGFSEYLAIDAINHSTLRLFSKSAAHARQEMLHPKEPTDAQDFGTMVHSAILEPDLFRETHVVAPKVDRRTREGKATWAAFEAENKGCTIVKAEDYEKITGILESVWQHPLALRLLTPKGLSEVVVVWKDNAGLCKARIDKLTTYDGYTVILDIKTTVDASQWAFSRAVAKYGYHGQAAFYLDGCNAVAHATRRFITLAIEKEPPFACALYEYGATTIEQGRHNYQKYMRELNEALTTGVWPGYPTPIQPLEVPEWAINMEDWQDE